MVKLRYTLLAANLSSTPLNAVHTNLGVCSTILGHCPPTIIAPLCSESVNDDGESTSGIEMNAGLVIHCFFSAPL